MQLKLSQSAIRSFRPDDAPAITKQIGTYSVARNMSMIPHPYSLKDAEEWIKIATSGQPETNFALTLDDQVVGGLGLRLDDPARAGVLRYNAELGYWLGEPFWGRGIMSEAVAAFTEWGFPNLDLVRIYAAVYEHNPASARVLSKAGFQFEGRLRARYFKEGQVIDGLLYAKVRL